MDMNFNDIPLVELHLHIDGSIDVKKAYEIIKRDNIKLGFEINDASELEKHLKVNDGCKDLNEYLEKFSLPGLIMQTEENIKTLVEELVVSLANEKIIYAELRFAPQKHTSLDLDIEKATKSALEGIKNGMKRNDNIKVKLILCLMRNGSTSDNMETINVAKKYLDYGVAGIDLAGAEALYKTSEFEDLFKYAKSKGVPFTIHAGEADGPSSIRSAIGFGATRIGHGTTLIQDEKLLEEVKEKNILLEVCPISNVMTQAVSDVKNHPVKEYIDRNLNVCIATDNITVQGTTLRDNYKALIDAFDITLEDIIRLNINAVKSSFMDEKDKVTYVKILEAYLN